jgi:hypothetical protein
LNSFGERTQIQSFVSQDGKAELIIFKSQVDLQFEGGEIITPYKEEYTQLFIEELRNKSFEIRLSALQSLLIMVEGMDIPKDILETLYTNLKGSGQDKIFSKEQNLELEKAYEEALWVIEYKRISSMEEKLDFLESALMQNSPRKGPNYFSTFYEVKSVSFLAKTGTDEAKEILEKALILEQNRERPYGRFLKSIENGIEEISLRQEVMALRQSVKKMSPSKEIQAIKRFLYEHKTPKTVSGYPDPWPVKRLAEIKNVESIKVLREIWEDKTFTYGYRVHVEDIFLRLDIIKPEEKIVLRPII